MLEHDSGIVRAVAWSEICPWLSILRTFRIAISLRVLVFGALGILLTLIGWSIFGVLFSSDHDVAEWSRTTATECFGPVDIGTVRSPEDWRSLVDYGPQIDFSQGPFLRRGLDFPTRSERFSRIPSPVRRPWPVSCYRALDHWRLGIFRRGDQPYGRGPIGGRRTGGLGGCPAIRQVQMALLFRRPAVSPDGSRAGRPYHGASWAGSCGPTLAWCWSGSSGRCMLLAGLLMALLLLGLVFGWPLMWATISTEGTDSFDALSRSYAYVFQRPLHYLFYAVVAAVLGWLGWLLVSTFASAVIWLTSWAVAWGCGADRIMQIDSGGMKGIGHAGSEIIHFWVICVRFLAVGYFYGYFWTAASAIYLLLRRDVDATEMDEVHLDADASEPSRGGPAPSTDENSGAIGSGEHLAGIIAASRWWVPLLACPGGCHCWLVQQCCSSRGAQYCWASQQWHPSGQAPKNLPQGFNCRNGREGV